MKIQTLSRSSRCGLFLVAITAVTIAAHSEPAMKMPDMSSGASPFSRDMQRSMAVMQKNMMAGPMTGNADQDFATMMIPHHQGAIDMAKAELQYGKDPVLRHLAQQIIADQNKEIALMQNRLKQLKAKSTPKHPVKR